MLPSGCLALHGVNPIKKKKVKQKGPLRVLFIMGMWAVVQGGK